MSASGQDSLEVRRAYLRSRRVKQFHDRRLTAISVAVGALAIWLLVVAVALVAAS